mmetsp:Transcript_51291/g.111812  ORF Transcript_51291/g.111812 Transcript_51291/m.111812 type:complete len:336 (+) Transcript_51291:41-1048(+)
MLRYRQTCRRAEASPSESARGGPPCRPLARRARRALRRPEVEDRRCTSEKAGHPQLARPAFGAGGAPLPTVASRMSRHVAYGSRDNRPSSASPGAPSRPPSLSTRARRPSTLVLLLLLLRLRQRLTRIRLPREKQKLLGSQLPQGRPKPRLCRVVLPLVALAFEEQKLMHAVDQWLASGDKVPCRVRLAALFHRLDAGRDELREAGNEGARPAVGVGVDAPVHQVITWTVPVQGELPLNHRCGLAEVRQHLVDRHVGREGADVIPDLGMFAAELLQQLDEFLLAGPAEVSEQRHFGRRLPSLLRRWRRRRHAVEQALGRHPGRVTVHERCYLLTS